MWSFILLPMSRLSIRHEIQSNCLCTLQVSDEHGSLPIDSIRAFRRTHQFDCFLQFETSLIADAFAMSLVSEYRRKSLVPPTPLLAFTLEDILQRSPKPFLIAKCAECTCRRELGRSDHRRCRGEI